MFNQSIFTLVIVFTSSVLIGIIIVAISKQMVASKRNDLQAVQAAHVTPVPRVGGIAITFALVLNFEDAFSFSSFAIAFSFKSLINLSTFLYGYGGFY